MISIIIPTLNEEKNIKRLLKELHEQSFKDIEIIIADANSTDRTRQVAAKQGAIITEGGLPGKGRNEGAKIASSNLLIFIDADAHFTDKDIIKNWVQEIKKRNLEVFGVQIKPADGNKADKVMMYIYNIFSLITEKILPHAAGVAIGATKQIHNKIKGFDESVVYAEDHDYARRAAKISKFGILRTNQIKTSMRSHERDGRLHMIKRYIRTEIHMVFKGPVKNEKEKYEFGHE